MDTRRILIDTNLPIEYLLDQDLADVFLEFMQRRHREAVVTEFTLNSIIVIAKRHRVRAEVLNLVLKLLPSARKSVAVFSREEALDIYVKSFKWELDFDDAHIKYIAERDNLRIVTFDKHLLKFPEISVHPADLV